MFKKIIFILIGLPGSGKSTWARDRVHKARHNKTRTVIISKDHIREMIHGEYVFDINDEPLVQDIANSAIKDALNSSSVREIIIDETNISKDQRRKLLNWIEILESSLYIRLQIRYVWFLENKRNLELRMYSPKGQSTATWKRVIHTMKRKFEEPTLEESDLTGRIKPFSIQKISLRKGNSGHF